MHRIRNTLSNALSFGNQRLSGSQNFNIPNCTINLGVVSRSLESGSHLRLTLSTGYSTALYLMPEKQGTFCLHIYLFRFSRQLQYMGAHPRSQNALQGQLPCSSSPCQQTPVTRKCTALRVLEITSGDPLTYNNLHMCERSSQGLQWRSPPSHLRGSPSYSMPSPRDKAKQ